MKIVRWILLSVILAAASSVSAGEFHDYDFEQERMLCAEDGIYIISTFDSKDKVTAYSYLGHRLWERAFHAKITSWQVINNFIIVFSKDRHGHTTYLTCLNRFSGDVMWQRP